MPRNYDATDLLWTSRGDYYIHDNDLMDTSNDPLRSLYQEIKERCGSDQEDWEVYPTLGANASYFVGEQNNKQTAESIKTGLLAALVRDGYINSKDVTIRYMPVSINKIIFRVTVKVQPTLKNGNSKYLTMNGLYNYEENQVSFIM
jgi:hypothetical protein